MHDTVTRRTFLGQVAVGGAAGLAWWVGSSPRRAFGQPAGGRRPNIVVIVPDDLGYGELGCYGGSKVPTPHIDALAAAGMRFTDGYAAAPVCAPSRAGFITGRYPQTTGIETNDKTALPAFKQMPTLAEYLKDQGYKTAAIGKWHLGGGDLAPNERGFDHFYGFMPGMWNYFRERVGSGKRVFWGARYLVRNGEKVEIPEDGYTTDLFTDEAVKLIEDGGKSDQPYFLYFAHQTPHTPLQATQKYIERVPKIDGDKYSPEPKSGYESPDGWARTYYAMIVSLDDSVGRVMQTLKDTGQDRDTLVIFWSDNGGVRNDGGRSGEAPASNDPLHGHKQSLYEGGIRIPYIAAWPGTIPAGTTSDAMVSSMDIFPTVADVTGGLAGHSAPLDGKSILPILTGKSDQSPHEALYWRYPSSPILRGRGYTRDHGKGAMRQGDWKLYLQTDGTPELYNLANDIDESEDLAKQNAQRTAQMVAAWEAWNATLPPIPSERGGE